MAKSHPTPPEDEMPTALGALLRAQGFTAAAPASVPDPSTVQPKDGLTLASAGKIVVRRERKGRGGKTVTLITGIEGPPAALDNIAKALRKALGCGAIREEQAIVVQGDQADRVTVWLHAHGAARVVRGA